MWADGRDGAWHTSEGHLPISLWGPVTWTTWVGIGSWLGSKGVQKSRSNTHPGAGVVPVTGPHRLIGKIKCPSEVSLTYIAGWDSNSGDTGTWDGSPSKVSLTIVPSLYRLKTQPLAHLIWEDSALVTIRYSRWVPVNLYCHNLCLAGPKTPNH